MNADTHHLLRRLVENAKEEHQLETDLRVDRYVELRRRLGQLQHKLDAIDDEALALYAEWDEDDDRRLVGLIE